MNHISAINPLDGTTCLHKTVEGGDNVVVAAGLLSMDSTVANIQDSFGLTSLHLACKLNRRKLVELLIVSVYFIFDINLLWSSENENFLFNYSPFLGKKLWFNSDFTVLSQCIKIAQHFQGYPFVDLNVRTKDGRLPEEMTSRRSIQRLVMQARQAQPQSLRWSLSSLSFPL